MATPKKTAAVKQPPAVPHDHASDEGAQAPAPAAAPDPVSGGPATPIPPAPLDAPPVAVNGGGVEGEDIPDTTGHTGGGSGGDPAALPSPTSGGGDGGDVEEITSKVETIDHIGAGVQLGDSGLPPVATHPVTHLLISSAREGFRRAGRPWRVARTLVSVDEFSAEQIEALEREPMFRVVHLDAEAAAAYQAEHA